MPFIELDTGIRMHYRDGGRQKKTLLFIPGLAATVETWNYQILSLQDRYRCIYVDMRGHGDSDKPYSGYTYNDMCRDIRSFVVALDLHEVTLIGWSMGAGIALNYVTRFNDDNRITKLAMVGPATPRFVATPTEPFGMDDDSANAALEGMRVSLPEAMASFSKINFHRDDMAETARWFLSLWLKMPAYAGYQCFKSLLEEDLREQLELVNLPVLVCHGRHDQVCHPGWSEYMISRLSDGHLVWFENSGHALMVEEPDKLSKALADFAEN